MRNITQRQLKEKLDYNPKTGQFKWISISKFSPYYLNQVAGTVNQGYRRITVNRVIYQAHRLAWLYMYGYMPAMIDHINNDKLDNRIANLRECNNSQNQRNRPMINGKYKGVYYHKIQKKYLVTIGLGSFDSPEDAAKAYNHAVGLLFGDFACFNDISG